MPVPDVDIDTVTSSSVAPDNVAVIVTEELAFSAIELALVLKVTVGADSFSVMVNVTCCVPFSTAEPPDTDDISKIAVSLAPSYTESSVGVKEAVAVVLPAGMVIEDIAP